MCRMQYATLGRSVIRHPIYRDRPEMNVGVNDVGVHVCVLTVGRCDISRRTEGNNHGSLKFRRNDWTSSVPVTFRIERVSAYEAAVRLECRMICIIEKRTRNMV
jgi:hypothetical protein